ncbi:MAG: hypothetical protein Q8Q09_00100 [Deltaproteobacteria bacterium]|nr:hypothetical protein [Deltaproteobacteria bacterium]
MHPAESHRVCTEPSGSAAGLRRGAMGLCGNPAALRSVHIERSGSGAKMRRGPLGAHGRVAVFTAADRTLRTTVVALMASVPKPPGENPVCSIEALYDTLAQWAHDLNPWLDAVRSGDAARACRSLRGRASIATRSRVTCAIACQILTDVLRATHPHLSVQIREQNS